MFRINQKGGTMVEAIAVISIMTVLGISAIKLIGGLFDGFKQNIVTSEIRELQKNVSARYSVDGHYGNLGTVATLVKEKVVPNQMLANGKIYHRLGGEVLIEKSALSTLYYQITFKDLSPKACMNLSQINWMTHQGSDLIQLQINSTVFVLPSTGLNAEIPKLCRLTWPGRPKVARLKAAIRLFGHFNNLRSRFD